MRSSSTIGLTAVSAIEAAHPEKEVFADLETADAGFLRADIASRPVPTS